MLFGSGDTILVNRTAPLRLGLSRAPANPNVATVVEDQHPSTVEAQQESMQKSRKNKMTDRIVSTMI